MLSNQLWLTAAAAAATSGAFLFLNPPIDQFSTQFDQFGFKFDQSTNSPHNLTNLNSDLTNRPILTTIWPIWIQIWPISQIFFIFSKVYFCKLYWAYASYKLFELIFENPETNWSFNAALWALVRCILLESNFERKTIFLLLEKPCRRRFSSSPCQAF